MEAFHHKSIMLEECMEALHLQPEGIYVDCTAGGGGHSSAILEKLGEKGFLYAFDKDPDARAFAEKRLKSIQGKAHFELIPRDFSCMSAELEQRGVKRVQGILADLGVSSYQLDTGSRGFSFRFDGPLDMRMDPNSGRSAAEWIAESTEEELTRIFFEYGEERYSRKIARRIVTTRMEHPFRTTGDLVECIRAALPAAAKREKQHPAKRVFQALRIAVNGELEALDHLLRQAPDLLSSGGYLAILSFHSLEDRRIKQAFRTWEHPCTCPAHLPCICGKKSLGRAIPPKGRVPSEAEIRENPRAHSARLRVFAFDFREE